MRRGTGEGGKGGEGADGMDEKGKGRGTRPHGHF